MASLVEQIFVQSGTGSAGGQGFGEYALRGAQLGQERQRMGHEQQRINLAEQQLAAQLALQPLKQTLLQQEAQYNSARLEDTLMKRDLFLKGQDAMNGLTKDVSMALSEATGLDALKIHAAAGRANPLLFFSPAYKELGDSLAKITQLETQQEYRVAQAEKMKGEIENRTLQLEVSRKNSELREAGQELAKAREARLSDQFDYQVRKWESQVPSDKLALFRERARAIADDLTLLADPAKREEKLKALAAEMGIGQSRAIDTAPATSSGATGDSSGFRIKVIKP